MFGTVHANICPACKEVFTSGCRVGGYCHKCDYMEFLNNIVEGCQFGFGKKDIKEAKRQLFKMDAD